MEVQMVLKNYYWFFRKISGEDKSFSEKNGGLSDARNVGIDHATGDYIGFVDSDDYVSETMFEEMVDLVEKHSAEIVICNIQKVDEKGNVTQKLTQIPNMPEK